MEEQEDEFGELQAWPAYRRTNRLAEIYLNFAGLSFEKLPGADPNGRWPRPARPLKWRLLLAWCHYYIVKLTLTVWLQFKHDKLLKQWAPKLRPTNASRPAGEPKCVLRQELELDGHLLSQLGQLKGWLSLLGDITISITGTTTMLFDYVTIFALFHLIASFYYLRLRPLRLDFLCFLHDPRAEWRAARRQQAQLVAKLVQSARVRALHSARLAWRPAEQLEGAKRRRDSYHLAHLLWSVCAHRLSRPANLSARWHRKLTRLQDVVNMVVTFNNLVFNLAVVSALFLSELYLRAEHRLELFRCSQWQPNGTLVREHHIQLAELASEQHVAAYQQLARLADHQVSRWTLISFGLNYELHLAFSSTYSFLSLAEFSLFLYLVQLNVCFFMGLFVYSCLDKLVWLLQVEAQIDKTVQLLELRRQRQASQLGGGQCAQLDAKLAKTALVSYLNYALFKSRFGSFQLTINLLIKQMTCSAAQAMAVYYLVSIRTDIKMVEICVMGLVYLVIIINFYLGICSYLSAKLPRMMRNVMHLVALIKDNPTPSLDFLAELWGRQVLDVKEMSLFFSFHSFGATISYDKIILSNGYILALLLILFRGAA